MTPSRAEKNTVPVPPLTAAVTEMLPAETRIMSRPPMTGADVVMIPWSAPR